MTGQKWIGLAVLAAVIYLSFVNWHAAVIACLLLLLAKNASE